MANQNGNTTTNNSASKGITPLQLLAFFSAHKATEHKRARKVLDVDGETVLATLSIPGRLAGTQQERNAQLAKISVIKVKQAKEATVDDAGIPCLVDVPAENWTGADALQFCNDRKNLSAAAERVSAELKQLAAEAKAAADAAAAEAKAAAELLAKGATFNGNGTSTGTDSKTGKTVKVS